MCIHSVCVCVFLLLYIRCEYKVCIPWVFSWRALCRHNVKRQYGICVYICLLIHNERRMPRLSWKILRYCTVVAVSRSYGTFISLRRDHESTPQLMSFMSCMFNIHVRFVGLGDQKMLCHFIRRGEIFFRYLGVFCMIYGVQNIR